MTDVSDVKFLREEFEAHRRGVLSLNDRFFALALKTRDTVFQAELQDIGNYLKGLEFDPNTMEPTEPGAEDYVDRRILKAIERQFPEGHQWHRLMINHVCNDMDRVDSDLDRIVKLREGFGSATEIDDILDKLARDAENDQL